MVLTVRLMVISIDLDLVSADLMVPIVRAASIRHSFVDSVTANCPGGSDRRSWFVIQLPSVGALFYLKTSS